MYLIWPRNASGSPRKSFKMLLRRRDIWNDLVHLLTWPRISRRKWMDRQTTLLHGSVYLFWHLGAPVLTQWRRSSKLCSWSFTSSLNRTSKCGRSTGSSEDYLDLWPNKIQYDECFSWVQSQNSLTAPGIHLWTALWHYYYYSPILLHLIFKSIKVHHQPFNASWRSFEAQIKIRWTFLKGRMCEMWSNNFPIKLIWYHFYCGVVSPTVASMFVTTSFLLSALLWSLLLIL